MWRLPAYAQVGKRILKSGRWIGYGARLAEEVEHFHSAAPTTETRI